MISYRPLRIYCMDNKIKLSNVIKACGLSMQHVTKFNRDENMNIKTIEKVCLELDIPVEKVVEIVRG